MTILTVLNTINFRKTGIISLILISFSVIFGFVSVPMFVRSQLRNGLMLKENSEIRKMWSKAPFAITFKMYVFNITNPDEVMLGAKPHVQQIGPYIFDEWKEKDITADDDKEDTVTFDMKNTFIFRPDLTKATSGLTGDEIVTMPHLLIAGGLIGIKRDAMPFLNIAIKAMTQIFKPETAFLTARVMDILFDGVNVDCSSDEFEAVSFCSQLRDSRDFRAINDTSLTFSLFGGVNGTSMGKFEVYRGIKDISKLGEVVRFNDEEEMDVWNGDCNKIIGTDSTIFAPFHKKSDVLYAFSPDLCRSLGAEYVHSSSYNGVPTGFYSADFGDVKSDPSKHCFCFNQEVDLCPPKGTLDLFPCTKAPLLASKPHFLDADERLVKGVDGLYPNREEHDIFFQLEMISSTPLSAAKRLQFSMEIEPVEKMPVLSKLRACVIPLFWVEESAHLNSTYTRVFRQLYTVFTINSVIKYFTLLVGIIGLMITVYGYLGAEKSKNITHVMAVSSESQPMPRTANQPLAKVAPDLDKEKY